MLHKSIPNARILAFKYDADIVNLGESAGQNHIDEHARILINHLRNYRVRTETQRQDIYFVAHSLGGIVLKNVRQLWFTRRAAVGELELMFFRHFGVRTPVRTKALI